MTCVNARDTITQADGTPVGNYEIYIATETTQGGSFAPLVTSSCRVEGGMWISFISSVEGDGIDAYGQTAYGTDTDKDNWPSLIASTNVIGVGFFPDDGSPNTIYFLGIDPVYGWNTIGSVPPTDPCSIFPFLGDWYANNGRAQLIAWGMAPIDVQVRTDGSNVWVIALARESVKYPYLWNNPSEQDACGRTNATFEDDWGAGHSDPFFHDADAGNRWWLYQAGQTSNTQPFGPYDDPGWDNSFRWQPARVTVWCGDLGGFTRLDTLEAQFDNSGPQGGLCSGIECAASSSEPGVLHVLWAEGGNATRRPNAMRGQRINYTRWDAGSKTLDVDVRSTLELGSGYVGDDVFVWTAEMICRNDHGGPIAIVWPWVCAGGPQYVSPAAEFWDLSAGDANVVQTMDSALIPTPAEAFVSNTNEVMGNAVSSLQQGFGAATRSQFASSLYTDPLAGNNGVYLVVVKYAPVGEGTAAVFYRIRADGSQPFEFMDATRSVWYSIIPRSTSGSALFASYFQHDFVSDPDNVWVPAGGMIVHLDRQCSRQWEILPAFPLNPDGSGYTIGRFACPTSTPPLVTLDGDDWVLGGGEGPQLRNLSVDPSYVASLKAKICRCCVPCNKTNLHIWQRF